MKAWCLPVFLYLLTSLADDKGSDIDITILPKIVFFILLAAYISLLPSQVYFDSCLYSIDRRATYLPPPDIVHHG